MEKMGGEGGQLKEKNEELHCSYKQLAQPRFEIKLYWRRDSFNLTNDNC